MQQVLFESERLLFRQMVPGDEKELYRMHTNQQVMQYVGMPLWESTIESTQYLLKNMNSYRAEGFGRWVVLSRSDNKWLGLAGLLRDSAERFIDLGYRFYPQFWGKGYATESVAAVLNYGFEVLNLQEIQARVAHENLQSVKVLEKAKFENYGNTVCMGLNAFSFCMNRKRYTATNEAFLPRE